MTYGEGNGLELMLKIETHGEKAAKTGGSQVAVTNTESPKLLRQKKRFHDFILVFRSHFLIT